MVERSLILIGLVVVGIVCWAMLRLWRMWKLHTLRQDAPLAMVVPAGRPAIVAFSTPSCAECRTRQAPALARLTAVLGESVTIKSLSALEHPDLIEKLGVLTVPATAVLDRNGSIQHINLGYTSDQHLQNQLASLR